MSALGALTSLELLPGVVVYLQDVIGLLGDSLFLLRLAEVVQGGLGLTQSWSPLVLSLVEEWQLFFFFLEEGLLDRLGEQSTGGSGERLFCRLVGRLSGRSGEQLPDRLAGRLAERWGERELERWLMDR
jgi:hypothetical protein